MIQEPVNTSREFNLLQERARLLSAVRTFFQERGVLEVDCPALSFASSIDMHIDVMTVDTGCGTGYLHTSPEYRMKELLSLGSGDIYQLGHVFRAGEKGKWHLPEFTMIEWYRTHLSFEQMIEETLECLSLFLPKLAHTYLTYQELFSKYLDIDTTHTSSQQLYEVALQQGICLDPAASEWDSDTLLQLLLSHCIEPQLGKDHFVVLTHFPASQAALARTVNGVALRFEIYYQGIELANGYQELTDPIEQRKRLIKANAERLAAGKPSLPIDERFLQALERGLPECTGVAVGFDRLLQLRCHTPSLECLYTNREK